MMELINMDAAPGHNIVIPARVPEGSRCSSSQDGARKRREGEAAPRAGEVSDLL